MKFDFKFFFSTFPKLIRKIPITIFLGILAFLIALILGTILEIMRNSKSNILRKISSIYISFFRATPYITQLFILYFGLPQIFYSLRKMTPNTALVISIAMNFSAFIAEIIRGALLSVDIGQKEAGISIGMSNFEIMKEIIFPQAIVSALPSLGNSFVNMIKSTAVGFTIGVVELLSQAKILASSSFDYFESYLAVGIVYWGMIVIIDLMQKQLEKRVGLYMKKDLE